MGLMDLPREVFNPINPRQQRKFKGLGLIGGGKRGEYYSDAVIARQGGEADGAPEDYRMLLHWAARAGNEEAVKLLVENKADINKIIYESRRPLHMTAAHGHELVVRLLLADADIQKPAKTDHTVVVATISQGHEGTSIARLLLAEGADPRYQDQINGMMVLHYAACNGNVTIVRMLPAAGANDFESRDVSEYTVLDYAKECAHRGVEQLIRDAMFGKSDEPSLTDILTA
ncbi:MAG: hypothetical protein M1839_008939 [Geoglossum umbratile]|nr:MAG: hypothetical protein M1839_008939 [Geoglossum umbratile]